MASKESKFQQHYNEVADNLALLIGTVVDVANQDDIKWSDVAELAYVNEQLKELVGFYCQEAS